ncbi:MAG TPA: AAA family ATPase, partial [Polyangiaceae bacterium]|nr:AAA family ATPase [Polyangiaceae bacterium]
MTTTRTLEVAEGTLESPHEPARSPAHEGEVVGRFRIVREMGHGGMGVVYKAAVVETGNAVAIKRVVTPDRTCHAALRAEFLVLEKLRHPYVVSVLDHGLSEAEPWYAMEWVEGTTLAAYNARLWRGQEPSRSADPPRRALVAGGKLTEVARSYRMLCDALTHVHSHGIVHRDLKPGNIILRDDGAPVLVDFGIASRAFGPAGRERLDIANAFMGSPLYAAPEQIRGDFVDARADLYSLGCLLYETLTGRPPFVGASFKHVLSMHRETAPDPPSALVDGVPSEVDRLVLRLLAKSPRDRIGHADDVAAVLDGLASVGARDAGPVDGSRRQAHLYRPALAGRAALMSEIHARLNAASQGQGCALLIEGESGIGKTFVASETARLAAMRSFQVITGECRSAAADGSNEDPLASQLHAFQGLLRAVADRCREGSLAFNTGGLAAAISTLAPYEPALEPFSSAAPDVRTLPPEAARVQMVQALTELLHACARESPLLLVIDDLHWVDELSLHFIDSLPEGHFDRHWIVFLGLLRPEEAPGRLRPLLGRRDVRRMRLGPLSREALVSMASDMLAMQAPPEAFMGLLVRRSEGNPFFAGEYLRLLAEEGILRRRSGAWVVGDDLDRGGEWLDRLALPTSIKDLISRRLRRLGDRERRLVEAAAVIGREFDVETLTAVVGADPALLASALQELVAVNIVDEVAPAGYRFAHDHVRGVVYELTDPGRRRALHLAAGLALEAAQSNLGANRFAELALHFKEASDLVRATKYLEKAADNALSAFANREAARLYADLVALHPDGGSQVTDLQRARWHRGLGDALHGLGKLEASRAELEKALRLLGEPAPAEGVRLTGATLRQLVEQAASRALGPRRPELAASERQRLQEAAQAYDRILQISYYRGQQAQMLHATLKTLNLSERSGPSPALAQAYAIGHAVAGVVPLRSLAEAYLTDATELLLKTPNRSVESYLLLLTGVYRSGTAQWELAQLAFERGLEIATELRFDRRRDEIRLGVGNWNYLRGRLDEAVRASDDARAAPSRRGDPQAQAWGALMGAQARLARGDVAEAATLAEQAAGLLPELQRSERIWTFATLAQVALRAGEPDRA